MSCVRARMYVRVRECVPACVHALCACVFAYVRACVQAFVRSCVRAYVCARA